MARILIVDDEEMDRIIERTILEEDGHELFFASDGEMALNLCRTQDVELILTDLAMPKFNGLRFIKELREDSLMMPVVAISGWAADQLDLALEYGADLSLSKPVDAQTLRAAVQEGLALSTSPSRSDPWKRVIK
ncbi:MAG: response regulator [Gemmatimonadota bacterium]|jgi:CheY-like chemotaxis protein